MKDIKKKDQYQKYLASIHAKLVTPDEIIQKIVKDETGHEFSAKTRIIAGEINEVYDLELENNNHVILRITKGGYPNFVQEKWAIEKVQKLGVPVPKILSIQYFKVGEEEKSACLMEKIDGEPLERGSIEFDKLDLKLRKQLINQAGEILSKIHFIKTEGFGWIVGEGHAVHKISDEMIDELLNSQDKFKQIFLEEDLDVNLMKKSFEIINNFRAVYSEVKPCLNHGDFSHKHFMVKNNEIVAILDWGGVRSDSPIYDFVWWDYWFGENIPTEWLKEGYSNKSIFDNNFNDLFHMLRLFKGLEILDYYHQENYKPAVEKAIVKLKKDLIYFETK